jgi:CRISPR-associated protein Cas4
METDESLYKATPQVKGSIAHEGIDKKTGSTRKSDLYSMPVYSDQLGIRGKIDIYKSDKKQLIERKNNIKKIFRGQIYQLWAQYFCMTEMGYQVELLNFYEISTNKMIPIKIPSEENKKELEIFIQQFKNYNPSEDVITVNTNKCLHCIYCNLCDKTTYDNVYT